MIKSIRFNSCYGSYDVVFRISSYLHGNGIFLELLTYPDLLPYSNVTVNLFDDAVDCSGSPFVFLDVNNVPGILAWMCDNDFSTGAISSFRSGFVDYPLVRLNLSRIKEFCYE